MNNAQTSVIIKKLCKKQNISSSKMLAETSIRKSLIYDMEKRDYTPSAEILEKIDYNNIPLHKDSSSIPSPEPERKPLFPNQQPGLSTDPRGC